MLLQFAFSVVCIYCAAFTLNVSFEFDNQKLYDTARIMYIAISELSIDLKK